MSIMQASHLMLLGKINAVCSNNPVKYINKLCGKKQIFLLLLQVVCRVTTGLEAVNMPFSKLYLMLHGKRLSRQIVMLNVEMFINSFKHAFCLNKVCKVR